MHSQFALKQSTKHSKMASCFTITGMINWFLWKKKNDDTFDYDEFQERGYEYGETYSHQFTTPSGDEMVVFGYYGHD